MASTTSPPTSPPRQSTTTTTTNGGPSVSSIPPSLTTKPKRSLRILCYGDSLTSGYSKYGSVSHPYSQTLSTVLSRAFPSLNIEAHVDGKPGDVVCSTRSHSQFLNRIEPKFLTKGGGTPYDWTIILGGTNDLAYGYSPADIYDSLKLAWAIPLSKGGRVLACTVPEVLVTGERADRVKAKRDELNALILGHKQENFFVFDLCAAIPYISLSEEEQKKYWDDNVHMTPEGYDLMGEKIAAALVNIIMPPGRLQSNGERAPKRRRVFKDDDKNFDEEDGDDSLLDQGYIIIRRKDLE